MFQFFLADHIAVFLVVTDVSYGIYGYEKSVWLMGFQRVLQAD